MAAVAGYHDGVGTGGLDLFHLTPAVVDAFLIVARHQGATPTATAELIHACRVEIDPIFHALVQDPAGFSKITVPEYFLGAAAVVAGIMIGGHTVKLGFIQLDTAFFDVAYQKIEYGDKIILFKCFGEMFFKPGPGCQIRVTSFGPQQSIDFETLHVFQDAARHYFHGIIVAGKITPAGTFPVLGGYSPILPGNMKYLPPMFEVVGMGVDQFIVNGCQDGGALLIDGGFKILESRFFGNFFGYIFNDEFKVVLGQAQIIPGFQGCLKAFMQDAGHTVSFAQGSEFAHDRWNVDLHGANILTFAAHGADPRPASLNDFVFKTKPHQADQHPGIYSVDPGNRTGTGAHATGQTEFLRKRPGPEFAVIEFIQIDDFVCFVHF